MKKLKCILFDLDGTLVDTTPLILESFKHTFLYHYNLRMKDEDLLKYLGVPLRNPFIELYPDAVDILVETYREFNEIKHDQYTGVFIGIADMLEKCWSKGITLGVVTSKRRELAMRALRLFNLAEYMDVLVGMEDTKIHKPKGDPVLKALEILKIDDPDSVLYVGDSTHDVLCAKDAGVHSAAVEWSYLPHQELHDVKPDLFLEKPADLLKYV
jgi:pyrophosphatase PpaX